MEVKRLAYLLGSLLFDQEDSFKMILSASINRDLKSDKKQILLSVLNSLPKLITGDTLINFVDNVKALTQNQDSLI